MGESGCELVEDQYEQTIAAACKHSDSSTARSIRAFAFWCVVCARGISTTFLLRRITSRRAVPARRVIAIRLGTIRLGLVCSTARPRTNQAEAPSRVPSLAMIDRLRSVQHQYQHQ